MATILIAGKLVAGAIFLGLVASIKTPKTGTKTINDYRENPEVLDEVLKSR
ncbi:MAG: hypothetical protein LIR46_04380 [Bacteroidota bacterium]|nr:hypothetical protein [Bacteroidota bacterium]